MTDAKTETPSIMDENFARFRKLEKENAALRRALQALEQAYSNSHSPQHRGARLSEARACLAAISGTEG